MTDPTDDTQPHPVAAADTDPGAGMGSTRPATPGDAPPPAEPTLRADPNRPADSGWREPAWFPPRDRARDGRPSAVAVVVGLAMIGVGLWFFLDRTLGVTLPRISWSTIWPVILIVIGAVIVLRSFRRNA